MRTFCYLYASFNYAKKRLILKYKDLNFKICNQFRQISIDEFAKIYIIMRRFKEYI